MEQITLGDLVHDARLLGIVPGQPVPPFVQVPQMMPLPRPGEICWIPGPDRVPGRFMIMRSLCRVKGPREKMILFVVPAGEGGNGSAQV